MRRAVSALLACLFLAGAPALLCAGPPEAPKVEPPAEKLRRALGQPVDIELAASSLDELTDAFRQKTKLDLKLDRTALRQVAIEPSLQQPEAVRLTLKGVPLREALRQAFEPFSVAPVIVNGAILLTPESQAVARQMGQRVDVNAEDQPLEAVLKQLAAQTAVAIVLDKRDTKEAAGTKVTMRLDDVALETAVRLLAELAGARMARIDNVLFVTNREKAAEIAAQPSTTPGGLTPGLQIPGGMNVLGGGVNLGIGGGALGIGGGALGIGGGALGVLGGAGFMGGAPPAPAPATPPAPAKPRKSKKEPGASARGAARMALFAAVAAEAPAPQAKEATKRKPLTTVLFSPVTFAIDNPQMTLLDTLDALANRYDVTIEFNEAALRQEAPDALKTPIAPERRLPPLKATMTLDRWLNHLLARVPPLTYMVRGETIEITTIPAQRSEIWGSYDGPYLPLVHATLEQKPLVEALRELSDQTGLNIVLDNRVTDKGTVPVTARLSNVPVDTAVRLLADMAELKPYLIDNVLYVTRPEVADLWEKKEKLRTAEDGSAPRIGNGRNGVPSQPGA